jgi:16S rRNA (guanine527-N7)-methyltransferase
VPTRGVAERVARRLERAGVHPGPAAVGELVEYLTLLARWNAKINLTALDVATPSDAAIDRLIVEPLLAARRLLPGDESMLDIGSGGGSPALPLKIVAPRLRVMMVESKVRKSAFLREAVRQLGLAAVEVENRRLEELLAGPALVESFDLITLRAVRADSKLWRTALVFLRPGGRVFWFRASGEREDDPELAGLALVSREPLISPSQGELQISEKTTP